MGRLATYFRPKGLLLGLFLFSLAFAIPIVLIKFKVSGGVAIDKDPWPTFPVKYSKTFFSVDTDKFNPIVGKDYMLVGAVLFRGLPQLNERQVFLNYTASSDESGIGLALYSDDGELRPSVYFRRSGTNETANDWYSFQPVKLTPHVWTIWAVSILNDKIIAVHISDGCDSDVAVGGAIELDNILLEGIRTLRLGSYANSTFRGALGPFYVINGNRFKRGLKDLFINLRRDICRGVAPKTNTVVEALPTDLKKSTRGKNTDGYMILHK